MTYSAIPANSEPVVVVAAAQRVHALDHLDGIARAVLGALASFATTERGRDPPPRGVAARVGRLNHKTTKGPEPP